MNTLDDAFEHMIGSSPIQTPAAAYELSRYVFYCGFLAAVQLAEQLQDGSSDHQMVHLLQIHLALSSAEHLPKASSAN
jgi:hypothetical protein